MRSPEKESSVVAICTAMAHIAFSFPYLPANYHTTTTTTTTPNHYPTLALLVTSIIMTISESVQKQFFCAASSTTDGLIRIPPTVIMSHNLPREIPKAPFIKTRRRLNLWTVEEHELFLRGLEMYPRGPWKAIAAVVATKTTRQTMTHAQKYRQKIQRFSTGQTIKINSMPTLEEESEGHSEVGDEGQEDAMLDAMTDVHFASDVSTAPSALFQVWELDAMLAELSHASDLQLDDFGAVL
jgi:SHAQKYF class myb-like DNA-binding protein